MAELLVAQDFRDLLKEDMRDKESGERWFQDIEIGEVFFLSVQASALHGCTPAELLDDPRSYEAFQVTVQSKHRVFTHGRRGAWQHLEEKSWWPLFESESPIVFVAESVPVATVQQIYEDLLTVVEAHPELAPRKGCGGGCGSLKPC